MEPIELTFERLRDMTDGFSRGRKLGQGGFGTVYLGKDKDGQEVAVKVLHKGVGNGLNDEDFKNEFAILKKLNHPHIVKLIGYCNETENICIEYQGKLVTAEETHTALCLEYLHKGSLQKFLSEGICDGPLDWHTRFKIIKGAFEGLKYLNEEGMYHLDLKPDNILLDKNMVPKLADFGLSKIVSVDQTRITNNVKGTFGYMPPEFLRNGKFCKMFDVFSMGAVMIITISGKNGRSERDDMKDDKKFIKLVHDSWRVKLQDKWSGSALEVYCQQVKRCTEMALKCLEDDKKNRPNIADIVHELSVLETAADGILLDRVPVSMDVHPTKPWILLVEERRIYIHSYETRETDLVQDNTGKWSGYPDFTLAKFVAPKKCIVAGDSAGSLHVYNYEREGCPGETFYHYLYHDQRDLKRSIVALAIHPTEPYMASAYENGSIKVWNFENGWNITNMFGHYSREDIFYVHNHLAFNPKGASILVSVWDNRIKIWDLNICGCIFTSGRTFTSPTTETKLSGSMESSIQRRPRYVPLSMNCLNYFSQGYDTFLIGGFSGGTIKVWDSLLEACVKRLETPHGDVCAACLHPDLPILITGSDDGIICLWNTTNFKIKRTLCFGLGSVKALECLKGSTRIVIGHEKGIVFTEIGSDETDASTEEAA